MCVSSSPVGLDTEAVTQGDGITSWNDGDLVVFQHGQGLGIKATSRSASSAMGQDEPSKRRKQEEEEKDGLSGRVGTLTA